MKNLMKKLSISSLLVYAFAASATLATESPTDGWGYQNPPDNVETDIEQAIMNVTNYILGFIAIIATLVIIYGGVRYLTAGGNEDSVAEAKKIIASGVIGMVIAGLAYAMVIVVSTIIL
ncbi:MAG: hypothetical protein KAQ87_02205 [Candidatus Pacebacteria bacterium]|nr:hypothetical protein [Candidatus Paceibacterota bacterium]